MTSFPYLKNMKVKQEQNIINNYSKTKIIVQEWKKYISNNNQDILNKIKKDKFDELSSLYYLVFQKQANKGYRSIFDFNKKKLYLII